MPIPLYLAMTAAEIAKNLELPDKLAYMACHFSPYSIGLSNLPATLPEGSMLILNDRIPVHAHKPERIIGQLEAYCADHPVGSVLLDFERPGNPLTRQIAAELCEALPCPVAVSEAYAENLSCSVFLKVPPYETLQRCCEKWAGRHVWLDAAAERACVRITESGAKMLPAEEDSGPLPFFHQGLCANYGMVLSEDFVTFTIDRSRQGVLHLLEEAEAFGVTCAVGLWQQIKA